MRRATVLAMILIAVPTGRLSSADEAKIRAVNEAYAAAWRRNDPRGAAGDWRISHRMWSDLPS